MSGTVGVVASDSGRYTAFTICLVRLVQNSPVNTAFDFMVGSDISTNRNALVEASLERGSEWMLFLDDDMTFPPNLLVRLLAHEVPVVLPLMLRRQQPYLPLVYSAVEDDAYVPISTADVEPDTLIPVYAGATGGMLVRSEVFRAIEKPWFQHGRVSGKRWNASEDLVFCEKVQEQGFPIHVDSGTRCGHLSSFAIWPVNDDGWHVGMQGADGFSLMFDNT